MGNRSGSTVQSMAMAAFVVVGDFLSLQLLSSYQDGSGYQLWKVCIYYDFVVVAHWETRPPVALPVWH